MPSTPYFRSVEIEKLPKRARTEQKKPDPDQETFRHLVLTTVELANKPSVLARYLTYAFESNVEILRPTPELARKCHYLLRPHRGRLTIFAIPGSAEVLPDRIDEIVSLCLYGDEVVSLTFSPEHIDDLLSGKIQPDDF